MEKSHTYTERINIVNKEGEITAKAIDHNIKVDHKIPKLGVMLVGWGGNNGTTLTAGILANKKNLSWRTKTGIQKANFFGSLTQSVTTKVGVKYNEKTNEVSDAFKIVKELVPLVEPTDLEITGWDISKMNLYEACYRAKVLEPTLVEQLKEDLEELVPMSSVLNPSFVASNQSDRMDNVFKGTNQECVDKLRNDIRQFREKVDKVVVLWTANTERFGEDYPTVESLDEAIRGNKEVSASVLFAYASGLEGCLFLNGSPQNTVTQGMIEHFRQNNAFIGGADFKTGQTKFKSLMLDFFMGSGLRLASCMSYNHLGNNDGKNLSEPEQFRSKEISKAGVLSDEIEANKVLYPDDNKEVDHTIVIKYCPFVGDSKRAMDEYTAQIFLNGHFTLVTHATCEDSLLAAPIMLDLLLLGEFFTRVKIDDKSTGPVLSYLSFFFKAPVTNHPEYVFNSFSRQKETLINFLKVCGGIPVGDSTLLSVGF